MVKTDIHLDCIFFEIFVQYIAQNKKEVLYLQCNQNIALRSQQDKVGNKAMTTSNYIINEIRNNANNVIVAFATSNEGVIVGDAYFDEDREALIASIKDVYGEVISPDNDRHAEISARAFGCEIESDIFAFCDESDPNRIEGHNIFFAIL